MAIPELDPFSQIHNAMWEMVNAHNPLRDLILPRNQIKYDTEDSQKDQISSSDTPELALLLAGFKPGKGSSNTTTCLARQYTWAITTGDFRVNEPYNPIAWELFRAMQRWATYLCPLTWKGHGFVNHFRILEAVEGTTRTDQNRGIRGWASLWDVEINMVFCTQDLLEI